MAEDNLTLSAYMGKQFQDIFYAKKVVIKTTSLAYFSTTCAHVNSKPRQSLALRMYIASTKNLCNFLNRIFPNASPSSKMKLITLAEM